MWKKLNLGEICDIYNGGTPNSKEKTFWGDGVEWLTPKDMGKMKTRFISKTDRQITKTGLANSSAKLVPENSVILSCRAPIGHVAINKVPMSFNQGCKGLVPKDELLTEFLYYFLVSSKNLLNKLGSGTTFKEISSRTLSNVEISFPPLDEQKRIVAKLDTAFAEIEKSLISKKLKFDFLKKLEDKIVCDVFKDYSEKKSIEDVTMKTSTINMNKKYPTKSFQYVDVSSVNKENLRIEKTQKLLGINAPSRARRQIQEGDVIFATIRPTLKRIAIVPKELNGQICSTGFSVLRGKKEILDNKYLFYILSSSITLRYMNTLQTGASYPAVTDKQIKEFMIPIPSIENQREIADHFENIFIEINKAKSLIYEVLKSYDSLKNSLLTNELAIK